MNTRPLLALLPSVALLLSACQQDDGHKLIPPDSSRALVVINYDADPAFVQTRTPLPPDTFDALEQQALTLINQARAKGVTCTDGGVVTKYPAAAPLQLEGHLQRAAEWHAADEDAQNYMDHNAHGSALHGLLPIERVLNAGYKPGKSVTNDESLAVQAQYADAQAVVTRWLTSTEGHCDAVANPDRVDAGLALVGLHWVMEAATPTR